MLRTPRIRPRTLHHEATWWCCGYSHFTDEDTEAQGGSGLPRVTGKDSGKLARVHPLKCSLLQWGAGRFCSQPGQ